ncbi:ABC-2 transporter permease [Lachnotalea glycerini]|jgi:ABC-2 type transport system permease protein|uniref:ABC-2 family transporter n=1 Tax=Lachnotalea glycerini TaxID=1763509 RepID=A0A371JE73_9FIRM|nr:ABC-2 transporter permease [Lachnotalea glycerini]RDY31070.1 hypothetical protein CG710_011340 [Lachnotalea glycerini]
MYLSLVKKDFKIVLRGNLGILVAQMLFILIIISVNMGIVGYGVMVTAFGWQLLLSVSTEEKKSRSLALLIAMPYEKGKIITTRYVSPMLGFAGVTLIYEGLALITNMNDFFIIKPLTYDVIAITMCAYALFISITVPLYLILSDSVVRGITIFLILGTVWIGYFLWNNINIRNSLLTMTFITNHFHIVCIIVSIISLVISRTISLQIFKKIEY